MSILVTGGNGRLGRAVLAQLGAEGIAGVRRPNIPGAMLIDDDGRVDLKTLTGIDAIVNCAGLAAGATDEIDRANTVYPLTLARAARDAGVGRFVQVSSFSVYGRVQRINTTTSLAPEIDYGRSKLAAEEGLSALAAPGFAVTALRLPFMFSMRDPALMGRLVSLVRRLGLVPIRSDVPAKRSMITYAGAAEALLIALRNTVEGAVVAAAADPRPFALIDIRDILRANGHRVGTLPVPDVIVALASRLVPGSSDRLFRSSLLADEANMMRHGTAYPVLAELAAYVTRLDGGTAGQADES